MLTKNQAFPGKPIEDVIITNNIRVHWIPDPLSHAKTLERMCLPAGAPQGCGGHGFLPEVPQNHGGMDLTIWCTPGLWGDGSICLAGVAYLGQRSTFISERIFKALT